jgi:hypothetical protein
MLSSNNHRESDTNCDSLVEKILSNQPPSFFIGKFGLIKFLVKNEGKNIIEEMWVEIVGIESEEEEKNILKGVLVNNSNYDHNLKMGLKFSVEKSDIRLVCTNDSLDQYYQKIRPSDYELLTGRQLANQQLTNQQLFRSMDDMIYHMNVHLNHYFHH